MKNTRKIMAMILCVTLLCGCTSVAKPTVSQTPAAVTVNMFGFWADDTSGIATTLQTAIKAQHPEITLVYEAFPTGQQPYMDELGRRMAHGQEADLFMTYDTQTCAPSKLLDLTRQPFVNRYSVATMQQLSSDGAAYYLPGVGEVQCYAYNTELISPPPQTLAEFEQMTLAMAESGGHPFIVPYEQTNTLLIKALAASYLNSPDGQIWLTQYNQGATTMADNAQWVEVWNRVQRLIDGKVLLAEDRVFAESRRTTMLAQGIGAMSTISSQLIEHLESNKADNDFQLLPLLGDAMENKTVFSAPTCYFAASARLSQSGNEAVRDAVYKVLDFISTEEGQKIIRGQSPLANSYLTDVNLPLDNEYQQIALVLEAGAYGPPPAFARGVEAVIGESFGKMLTGEMTAAQAILACDKQNESYTLAVTEQPPAEVIGTASEAFPWTFRDSRTKELAVTNFVVDSMAKALETDMAIELGTAVRGEFFPGDITTDDIASVIRVDKKLYRAQITGQQLWDIIEQGIIKTNSSWFIIGSGLRYSYQPQSDDALGKLLTLQQTDGTPIDLAQTYTIAVSENQMMEVPNVYNFFGSQAEETSLMLRQAVIAHIQQQKQITPTLDGRIMIQP